MIIALDNMDTEDATLFGTKAAFMGSLANQGIAVPPGFALSVEFFDAFFEYNNIPFIPQNFLTNNKELIRKIQEGTFPESRENILRQLFSRLAGPEKKLIIRSSALCEDNYELSFTNVFASAANIQNEDDMLKAIKKCFASLFSDKSLAFARQHAVSFAELKMGIIIQEYIQGQPSGSIFSAGVEKLASQPLVIQWVAGSSEQYINGNLPREHLLLPRRGKISSTARGLTDTKLKQLRELGLKSEKLIGYNQDLEWTFHSSKLYALQSRPTVKESSG